MNDASAFCLSNKVLKGDIIAENDFSYLVPSLDPVLQHSMMIIPRRHVSSVFNISPEEWASAYRLLRLAKTFLDEAEPDGYNVGWNVGRVGGQTVDHVHMHVIARFADEPLAGKGIRHALKQPDNARPDN
ncbi:MAG TPA: HIT family protein [Thermomicrobiales bacterium]|nr:HIT family protein [Thermomicrobiales bacterium]